MRRGVTRTALALVTVGLAFAAGSAVPEALARVEVFRVGDVDLVGSRFLTLDEALRVLQIAPEASIWDDPGPWEARLATHPLVRRAEVKRRLPGTLVLVVEENEPVALVPTPTLEPVDRDGRYLPVDPTVHRLDLPILHPAPDAGADGAPGEARLRPLARAVEGMRRDPMFYEQVSEIDEEADGTLRIRWGAGPSVVFHMETTVDPRRIREGLTVLADALERTPDRQPRAVDLRWADQVVVRY